MFLSDKNFLKVISLTPLVSIDILALNSKNEILLGMRKNAPARGKYFVPGGRILKNEPLGCAFSRLSRSELNRNFKLCRAHSLGLFEHFYTDSFFDDVVSTHYIANAFKVAIPDGGSLPLAQHSHYKFFNLEEALNSPQVHKYTKQYIQVVK